MPRSLLALIASTLLILAETSRLWRVGLGVIVCVLSTVTASADTITNALYDATVSLTVSPGPSLPAGASLHLFPGVTITSGNASATAAANVPGHLFAAAHGEVVGFGAGGGPSFPRSEAGAIGSGFLISTNHVQFPLVVHEDWSVSAFTCCSGLYARADIRFRVLLDDITLLSVHKLSEHPVQFHGGFDQSRQLTTPLTLNLSPGIHSLTFAAEAAGIITPEPATILLFGSSLAGIGVAAWKRRRLKQ